MQRVPLRPRKRLLIDIDISLGSLQSVVFPYRARDGPQTEFGGTATAYFQSRRKHRSNRDQDQTRSTKAHLGASSESPRRPLVARAAPNVARRATSPVAAFR